uniref:Protein-kinase domain of fam69 n=1 Tax=Culex tarsalis TaxID=7177 RepID=A0A1Q3F484_CULTA
MSSSYQRILVNLHVLALLFCVIFEFQPKEPESLSELLVNQCEFDTQQLCPACFTTTSVNCAQWANFVTIDSSNSWNQLSCRFNPHGVSYGLLSSGQKAVIKKLNKNRAVEALRDAICDELGITRSNCKFSSDANVIQVLRRKVLEQELEGCIICPSWDETALNRLLNEFKGSELLKLILLKVNVQPLLLELFERRGFPVPKVIFQGGFQLLESFDGNALVNFYDSPLNTRLIIAKKLIEASFRFTEGVNGFRFYLTDINPDNIAVRILPDGTAQVSFIDLDNVIILDSQSKQLDRRTKARNVHSRIDCDGCFAYVQEDLCSYWHSDINQFAICQLLYENLNGAREGGFLHVSPNDESYPALSEIRQLLHHCVYCVPPGCRDRQGLLQQVHEIINGFIADS